MDGVGVCLLSESHCHSCVFLFDSVECESVAVTWADVQAGSRIHTDEQRSSPMHGGTLTLSLHRHQLA